MIIHPMDGKPGPATIIAVHLYDRPEAYRRGFEAGLNGKRPWFSFRRVVPGTSAEYARGYRAGARVAKFGANHLLNSATVGIESPPVPPKPKPKPTADPATTAPRKRSGSYRDPDLSDKWLSEADHRAQWDDSRKFQTHDARVIIRRLVAEIRRINKETGR